MYIVYKLNGFEKVAEESNEDLDFSVVQKGTRITAVLKAKTDLEMICAVEEENHQYNKDDLFFVNGYQSWTDSFEYSYKDHLKDANKLPKVLNETFAFAQYGDAYFYNYDKNVFHGFDVSYVKGINPVFIGNFNYRTAYLIIEHHKKENILTLKSDLENLSLNKDESITIFDFLISSDIEKGKEEYFNSFKKCQAKKLFGYTSWYNHYQNINENIIETALEESADGFELFQIDDGFEEYVGDWLKIDAKKFPNGLKPIVEKIHAKGLKAGIWLAPFAAETKSAVFKEHPSWFIKDENGNPLKTGANWSHFYALDLDNPEAISYIKTFLKFYLDLGFDFFKLDFLYSVSLIPNKRLTRAQTAQKAYDLLREILGDKLILGCGAVISNCYETFDYLRIGPDVSLIFDDVWYMRKMHRERISTKVTLRNTIYRHLYNGSVFLNDPDVFLLRDNNIKLSKDQKKALTMINALFGSLLMTSDNPKEYNKYQSELLDEALTLFREGKVCGFETKKGIIKITYELQGSKKEFSYNIKKGTIC